MISTRVATGLGSGEIVLNLHFRRVISIWKHTAAILYLGAGRARELAFGKMCPRFQLCAKGPPLSVYPFGNECPGSFLSLRAVTCWITCEDACDLKWEDMHA
jgi:hypothetical protein